MLHCKRFHIETERYPYGNLHTAVVHVRKRGTFRGHGRSRASAVACAVARWRMARKGLA